MRCGWAGALVGIVGCAPADPGVVEGTVVRDGHPVAGADVWGADVLATTGSDGRFTIGSGESEPPSVVAFDGDRRVASLSCEPEVTVDLSVAPAVPMGTLALVLDALVGEPELHLHMSLDLGDDRESDFVPFEPELGEWVLDGISLTNHFPLPADRPWALTITNLQPRTVGADVHAVVDQVLVVGGDPLQVGEVRYLDVLMSDETLRSRVWWDTSGPPGVEEATFLQRVEVRGIPVDLTTWRGPVDRPIPVPVVEIVPGDDLIGFRGEFRYNGAESCTGRWVGMQAVLGVGQLPRSVVHPGSTDDRLEEVQTLLFPDPFPPPPSLLVGGPDGVLAWSFVPSSAAKLVLDLRWGDHRWIGWGGTGCRVNALRAPGDSGRVHGTFGWSQGSAWGRCEVGGPAKGSP